MLLLICALEKDEVTVMKTRFSLRQWRIRHAEHADMCSERHNNAHQYANVSSSYVNVALINVAISVTILFRLVDMDSTLLGPTRYNVRFPRCLA